jgi:hypothetical protein
MTAELKTIWDGGVHDKSLGKVLQIMEKYFGKRTE